MKENEETEITKRLDAVIRLLMAMLHSKESYGLEKIYLMLEESGLGTGDIGKITGKPSKTISAILINAKKSMEKKKNTMADKKTQRKMNKDDDNDSD